MKIDIQYDNKQVLTTLNRLSSSVEDMRPMMRIIAGHLHAGVEEAFIKERSPAGKPWAKRKPSTLKQKKYREEHPNKILQLSGHLVRSITAYYSHKQAIVGTNIKYAATHQFGRGPIPARPYLGISRKTNQSILNTVRKYLIRKIK